MVGFTSIRVGLFFKPGLYGSPPGEEQEVVRVKEEIVIEPVVGIEEEAVVEQVCIVNLNNACIYFSLNLSKSGLISGVSG